MHHDLTATPLAAALAWMNEADSGRTARRRRQYEASTAMVWWMRAGSVGDMRIWSQLRARAVKTVTQPRGPGQTSVAGRWTRP